MFISLNETHVSLYDGGFFLNRDKDLFKWDTGAIMTECSS